MLWRQKAVTNAVTGDLSREFADNRRSVSTLNVNGCDGAHYAIAFVANDDPPLADPKKLRWN